MKEQDPTNSDTEYPPLKGIDGGIPESAEHPLGFLMPIELTDDELAVAGLEARLQALGLDPKVRAGQISPKGGTNLSHSLRGRLLDHC